MADMDDPLKELADVISAWHANKKKSFDDIIKSTDDGKPVKLDLDGTPYELAGDKLAGFRIGLISARAMLGNLPFTLEENKSWDDEAEEELEQDEPVPPRPENFGHFS
ncbi:host nuclease inhibitor protein [Pseudomonas phage hairong]|nr:host nuclease inhibitor protein [Pseudomonas phage hairong]